MKNIWIIALLLSWTATRAQDTPAVRAQLNEAQWKAVSGYFQSPNNDQMYVQFTPREGLLEATLLWNNLRLALLPASEVSFVSRDEVEGRHIHVIFQQDSSGGLNVMKLENQVWKRAREYKPVVRKVMDHTPRQLEPFVGLYQYSNDAGRFIRFFIKDNSLILRQGWDDREISFSPESELSFFSPELTTFSLRFVKGDNGAVTQAIAFGRDIWNKAEKPSLTPAILKTYEGRFRSKDDPDNEIQVIARGDSLVVKQLWDGKETGVQPWTNLYFYNEAQSYPLQIVKNDEGKIIQAILLQNNVFDRVGD
ncbi:MAG TPA: hypothetical protein VL547_14880 [Dinghuibacter sp.]|jgi:hypothetical protein|uniref:hypothetical protein n=1 Tax=Dinghuibacter sp. TaxID=2024697 RepID=UPI002C986AF2|nr:hypothetical protein [Dinghuibacter sp.]HTJ13317.1 hypothetical protein [Dinghuibacter sp.]